MSYLGAFYLCHSKFKQEYILVILEYFKQLIQSNFNEIEISNKLKKHSSDLRNKTHQICVIYSGMLDQDCLVSTLSRGVQAPVNICDIKDSLHKVCDGAGRSCWSCHIVAIDRAAINASNIHIVRLIILVSLTLAVTSLLYG